MAVAHGRQTGCLPLSLHLLVQVPSAGQGLVNMRERAELLPEGSLSVDAAPGEGCRLCLRWRWQPLDAETPQEASETP